MGWAFSFVKPCAMLGLNTSRLHMLPSPRRREWAHPLHRGRWSWTMIKDDFLLLLHPNDDDLLLRRLWKAWRRISAMNTHLQCRFCFANNEYNRQVNAYNSWKTADNVAWLSFCMPLIRSRRWRVLSIAMASQTALHRARIGVRRPCKTGLRHSKIIKIIYRAWNNSVYHCIIVKRIAYNLFKWINSV